MMTRSIGEIDGTNICLTLHGCVDSAYTSKAESHVRNMFRQINVVVEYEQYQELVVLTGGQLEHAREMYGFIGTKYMGNTVMTVRCN